MSEATAHPEQTVSHPKKTSGHSCESRNLEIPASTGMTKETEMVKNMGMVKNMMNKNEPTVYELSVPGRKGVRPPEADTPTAKLDLPEALRRSKAPQLPELSELDAVRHFTRISQKNFGIDTNFYPLGSCTMKYNPRVAEAIASFDQFAFLHPEQPEETLQGALELLYTLEKYLAEISGMDAITLAPAAGAHGELTGILMIRAYHEAQGNPRKKILIPDTAHGTNPASAAIAGYSVSGIKTGSDGILHPEDLKREMNEDVAAIMLTNPNTLGIFESKIQELCKIVHDQGGLVYCDGANLNAIMGHTHMGMMGADLLQFNLHKTFATPHGGGGPGAGPVGVRKILEPFLPTPRVVKEGERYRLNFDRPQSIGRIRSFVGNFMVCVRALSYILSHGPSGLKNISDMAVLNANYIKARLKQHYFLPYEVDSLHEVVFSDKLQAPMKVKTLDMAKRLLDYGFHPPTIYFPLVVHGALMIEPTETESLDMIDKFCAAMIAIAEEVQNDPELVRNAPHNLEMKRLDEVLAAKNLQLTLEI